MQSGVCLKQKSTSSSTLACILFEKVRDSRAVPEARVGQEPLLRGEEEEGLGESYPRSVLII